MARHEHLRLVRLPEQMERRKRRGFGKTPVRNVVDHSLRLQTELNQAIAEQVRHRKPEFVDPSLILRVRMSQATLEDDWESLGLTLLASDEDKSLVLFASADDLNGFQKKLNAYSQGTQPGRAMPAYNNFISSIEEIGSVQAKDRIGPRFLHEGLTSLEDFDTQRWFVIDVELWEIGSRHIRDHKSEEIGNYVIAHGGEIYDRYAGPSITMLRARTSGTVLRELLTIAEVATIDLPPQPDLSAAQTTLARVPPVAPVPEDAPVIGVIDSGSIDHPLLQGLLVGAIGVPATLGTADDHGHGTRVAGVAVFGDVAAQLEAGTFESPVRIASAKVVNAQGAFDDRRLVPSQMREAITSLHGRFGCRVFVISLGDPKQVYDGTKVGPWSATLDELVRELDVVIVVSCGNRHPRAGANVEQGMTGYPAYLLEDANRLLEPAGAVNVVTVGSLAHGEGLGSGAERNVHVQRITDRLEPSPFTRIGLVSCPVN